MKLENSNPKAVIFVLLFFGSLLMSAQAIAAMGDIVYTLPIPDAIRPYYDGGIEYDGTHLWAPVNRLAPEVRVYEIDPSNGKILRSYLQTHYDPRSSNVIGLAYDRANNLIYNHVYPYGPIYAVDADTLVEVPGSVIPAPAHWIHDITYDGTYLWALTGSSIGPNYNVYKLDPWNGAVLAQFWVSVPNVSENPIGITWDGKHLWITRSLTFYQIDQERAIQDGNTDNAVLNQFSLPFSGRLACDGTYLWSQDANNFYQISIARCFIATAAYGSRVAKEVRVFEKVRDEYLLTNELGRAFVSGYYKYSPSLAHWIAKHPAMRRIARIGLYPVLEMSKWLVREK